MTEDERLYLVRANAALPVQWTVGGADVEVVL